MRIKFQSYKIGLLTKLFNITADTLRIYEKKGLLCNRRNKENNYREYERGDIFSLAYIMRLKELGLSLDTIKQIICELPLNESIIKLENHMREIEIELKKLENEKNSLNKFVDIIKSFQNTTGNFIEVRKTTFLLMDIEDSIPQSIAYLKSLDPEIEPCISVYMPSNKLRVKNAEDYIDEGKRELAQIVLTCEDINHISKRKNFPTNKVSVIGPSNFLKCSGKVQTGRDYNELFEFENKIKELGIAKTSTIISQYIMTESIYENPVDYYNMYIQEIE